ncbi:M20 family metallopeptidase [Frankia sp. CNm7]|uniref:Peptidase M20 domain-containing protein 2 n=1 Tax=Frankia nepalensis TaxID=1836974 RepID=A0A937UWB4_9ACTN|nr:M20 family metallopeptidase [Frankia nepalensis]MBL7498689.1 M20 family metallopeptidase [Frankia nepalensis]MBL7509146.1 M20 family metallopeptidase [Frankia nepalensis]MBL7518786.1 M20 family metallopeptidase [Frankia nepalensis]MBL7633226.1 M20 family metallopeptidase [Frankia nepalensis]
MSDTTDLPAATTDLDLPKSAAGAAIRRADARLRRLSHDVHANPETRFTELKATAWASELLERHGFAIERGVADLETAFVASYGTGPLVLGICAEYDALPTIGHACGHNIICASSVGAGLGLATVADDLGLTVKVIGTPAEEGGGGKIIMLDAGVFDGVHAAMMTHPFPGDADILDMTNTMLASVQFEVEFRGRASHAAGGPSLGINALDAVTVAQTAIGLLRQQLPIGDLVHGIVTHGGDAPNIIPERTVLSYYVRSLTIDRAEALDAKIRRCFEAGALATGCEVEIRSTSRTYSHMEADVDLTRFYGRNAAALGRDVLEVPSSARTSAGASTDMANVSLALPAIHPGVGIAHARGFPHHADFTRACATSDADATLLHAATALAWTAIDAAGDADVRERLLRGERRTEPAG